MEGVVILEIVAGLFVLLVRSMRQRARAGLSPIQRSFGRTDHMDGLLDADFDRILEDSRSTRR